MFVCAGSLINNDVKHYSLVADNPARRIGWIYECGVKLNANLICDVCAKQYVHTDPDQETIGPLKRS